MKEENELLRKIGKESPFKVPDTYFDDFTTQLMDKLPEKPDAIEIQPVTTWMKLRPYVYMAAMFIGAVLMIKGIHFIESEKVEKAQKAETEIAQDKYIDQTVEGSRMDEYQLYTFLTEANEEPGK
jgi:hypothetical protein